MKMRILLRNITKNREKVLSLPMTEATLESNLNPDDEYIIAVHEPILDVSEFENIRELNEFLLYCIEKDISETTLSILSQELEYHEVKEKVLSDSYSIVSFNEYASVCGVDMDITNSEHKGQCLYDTCSYNPFEVVLPIDLYDWIDWESVWTNAECEGWRVVRYNNNNYLVNC